jgi:hypothetical protein
VPFFWKLLYCDYKAIDEFMALRFTVTGALLAAKRMRILPISQHV